MAGEFSVVTNLLMSWLNQPVMWAVVIGVAALCAFVLLLVRKRQNIHYPCHELIDRGGGKISTITTTCGYIGKKNFLNNLIWFGPKVLKTWTGKEIYFASSADFQDINGKKGIYCMRDPQNQNVLVPISKMGIKNMELFAEIAPASYIDVGRQQFQSTVKETADTISKILPYIGIALIVGAMIIGMILNGQMNKQNIEQASELLLQAGDKGAQACRDICTQVANVVVSGNTGGGGAP